MRLPSMQYVKRNRAVTQITFGGLNRTAGAKDGEIRDMENMTTDHYPVMASRLPRWKVAKLQKPGGIVAMEKLGWVDGDGFWYDGVRRCQVTPGKKTFATMGKRIIILPDRLIYDTQSGQTSSMGAKWSGTGAVFGDGKLYDEAAKANAITVAGVAWDKWFAEGDGVTISGCTVQPKNNKSAIIRQIAGDKLYFYENSFTITGGSSVTESGSITIERAVPELRYAAENENRLWGTDGKSVYCCKPGDPTNWNVFDGLESDSWTVMPESPGEFTAVTSYKGFPQFQKENKIYKVYGSYPSNFQLLSSATMGVEPGSGESLAIAGETMFWLGLNGIVGYSGGIPTLVSQKLGEEKYRNAVAGTNGVKYYVSMEDDQGRWGLYVFDTRCSAWCREDDTHAIQFANIGMDMYCLTDSGEIWLNGDAANVPEGAQLEDRVHFWAEFAAMTDHSIWNKSVTAVPNRALQKVHIRATKPIGIRIKLEDHPWMPWGGSQNTNGKLETIPSRECFVSVGVGAVSQYALRIEGDATATQGGDNQVKVLEMTREFYQQKHLKNQG